MFLKTKIIVSSGLGALIENHLQIIFLVKVNTQPAITCSKLTIETLEQSVKYVQS